MPDSSSSADASEVPPIRTFQFDSGSIGRLSTSVNMFRGDVNIPQSLFRLPGRKPGKGLDVDFTILYQSFVYRDAILWNRDAPTSVVGMGWDFPLTYIQAVSAGSPDPDTRSYVLYDNGGANSLIRQPLQPFLYTIPESLASSLQAGALAPAILTQFLENGLPLDAGTEVTSGPGNMWTLTDSILQQEFVIENTGASLNVSYGGQAFQLQSYQFWYIVYFPGFERWLIVTDDGIRKSFGGAGTTNPQGYRTSAGNSIAWQVWWAANGVPLWSGPSEITDGQVQVAAAWYLESLADCFGDSVAFEYNGWTPNNGIIPEAEQQVGSGGSVYTKAVYLTQVTDVYGRTAVLNYGEKLPQEYCDPHRDPPGNSPNAYQDQYETKYLSSIAISDLSGNPLIQVNLDYQVANLAGQSAADLSKRYLTGVTIQNAEGSSLPGYAYAYYLDPAAEGAQPGALQMVTCPQGGTATYSYTQQSLDVCVRDQQVPRPADIADGVPRVFYGDNYVVTLWYYGGAERNALTLQVYTWLGRWVSWQLQPETTVIDTKGVNFGDTPSLNAIANADFFAVTFDRDSSSVAYVFNKDAAHPGVFVPATVDGVTTAPNKPTLDVPRPSGTVRFTGGDTFLAAANINGDKTTYQVLSWNWAEQAWTSSVSAGEKYLCLAAAGEYLVTVDLEGNVRLSYLDGTLTWQGPETRGIPKFTLPGNNISYAALVPGPGFAVLSLLDAEVPNVTYQVTILQWDADHSLRDPASYSFADIATGDSGLTWIPSVVDGQTIAINGNVLRFNGSTWLSNSNLAVTSSDVVGSQRYSYGPDYALQIIAPTAGATTAYVLGFDPNRDSSGWTAQPAKVNLPNATESFDNWPAAGGEDYALLGRQIYFRGTATDWGEVAGSQPMGSVGDFLASGDDFVSQSLINEGPGFLSFSAFPANSGMTSSNISAQSILFQNGQAIGTQGAPFAKQKIYTPSIESSTAGPGVSPQGPQVFVTYKSDADFNQATEIILHYYAGNDLSGNLTHYPVTRVDIDDQYQEVASTSFTYNSHKATCDPSGLAIKYYETITYPGTADPVASAPYGYRVTNYLNALAPGFSAANYFDMLDGLLLGVATYSSDGDNEPLESRQNQWAVTQQVASDPLDAAAPIMQLYGGWVAQTSQTSMRDGLTTTRTTNFVPPGLNAPYTGQPASVWTQSYNGAGNPEKFTQMFRYAVEVNTPMRALNMRSVQAQSMLVQTPQPGASVVVKSSAATFVSWPAQPQSGLLAPAKEASFRMLNPATPDFDYTSYTQGALPEGWLLEGRVTRRTALGQMLENQNASGVSSHTLFSSVLTFAVAQISNAAVGAAAYLGFEPYEDIAGWTLQNTQADSTDVRTGTTSLRLPGGASAEVAVSVTPAAIAQTYVAGFWYKTAAGFTPMPGAGCTVDGGVAPAGVQFQDTNGEWALETIGVPLTAAGAVLNVTIANSSAQDVRLDCVWIVPLTGSMIARTYDPSTQVLTSVMDSGGRTHWTYHDLYLRPTVTAGIDGQPTELAQRFLSRLGSASGAFDASSPNAELTLHPADGGTFESFVDGGAWQQNWQPSNASSWQASVAGLAHTATSADTLTYQGSMSPVWAVYFEVGGVSGQPALSVSAGATEISYGNSGYSCSTGATPLTDPPQMAQHWLLVAGDGVLLFFGDGQLIFSQTGSFSWTAPAIATSSTLILRNLTYLASPRTGLAYVDGSGRHRQFHQLYGADSRVTEVIYDPLNRGVATTRVAPGSFGSGASQPVLQYRPGFVDVDAFLASLNSTGAMIGDLADYYMGQTENGVQRSNDAGYPYRGTRWENSPRQCQLEFGLPGLAYAIAETTPPTQRNTTQLSYGTNPLNENSPLKAGNYSQMTVTTPRKQTSARITDMVGQSVATSQYDAGSPTSLSAGVRSYTQTDDGPQVALNLLMPNALLAGPQSDPGAFLRYVVTDAAARAVYTTDPNAGQTNFLYDPCGRIRFIQPQLAAGEGWLVYNKYDPLGRCVEQGTVAAAWDPATLAPLAADPSWPDSQASPTVALAITFDGDGNDATQIGQKASTISTTPGPAGGTPCVVTETFTYDACGRISSVQQTVSGPASGQGIASYAYNNLNELTVLTMPAGSPLSSIYYMQNDQGWITTIGTSAAGSDIAAYTYTIDGKVEIESLDGGAWTRSAQYLSPGWLQQVTTSSADGSQSHTLSYTYNPDSTVATRQVTYAFGSAASSWSDSYVYDGQGRLTDANGSSDEHIGSYDPNGNIWAASQATNTQSFMYASGTDELSQATIAGQASTVTYDANGRLTSALGRVFTYDNARNLTVAVSAGGEQVQLGYGGIGQRMLKVVGGQTTAQTLYLTGAAKVPLLRTDGTVSSAMVYGPTGLVAVVSDQTYFPIKDNEQSVWAVVNSQGLVAQYTYLPFGGLLESGPNPTVTFSRFMGQEWDSELSLYNFRDRMYDPVLRRFLAPDPARQFPSPYVFCGNNPLSATDPSGDLSIWAEIGIGIGMGALVAAGIAISVGTFGAALAPVLAGEAAATAATAAEVGGAAAAADVAATAATTTTAAASAGAAAAGEGGTAAAAAGGTAAAASASEGGLTGAEVAAGASTVATDAAQAGASETAASSGLLSWSTVSSVAQSVSSNMLESMGESGIQYQIQSGRNFQAAGFFEALNSGAVSGAISGVLNQIPIADLIASRAGLGALAKFGVSAVVQGVEGATSSAVSNTLSNLTEHKPAFQGLLTSLGVGFGESFAVGALSDGISGFRGNADLATDLQAKITSGNEAVNSLIETAQAKAVTNDAYMCYGTAAFFSVAGFSVWGTVELFK